jgi:hypothetical protein
MTETTDPSAAATTKVALRARRFISRLPRVHLAESWRLKL